MAIDTTCPGCGRALRVDDSFAGRQTRCPMCKHVYTVFAQDTPSNLQASNSPSLSSPSGNDSWENYDPRRETAPHPGFQSSAGRDNPILQPLIDSSGNLANSSDFPSAPIANSIVHENAEKLYYIRIPNGQIYGPSNAATLKDWASQGRLNSTCDVRLSNVDIWISYSAWLIQQNDRSVASTNPNSASATRNIYGDNFGGVATPMNQTPSKPSGLGIVICCLGVASWFLCISFVGAPICAAVTVFMAVAELKKIAEGRSPREERALVHIGLWLSVANLVACFCLLLLFFVIVAMSP